MSTGSKRPNRPCILIAPLNWGLGHAARSVPIAAAFAKTCGAVVHWASDGGALELLRRERPNDRHFELPSYGVRYPTRSARLNMLLSAPRMLSAIQAERRTVARLHAEHDYDFILSDNRYGCRVTGVPSSFLTHQVHLPIGARFGGGVAQRLHRYLMHGFDEVVVPDYPTPPRLAGDMSAPAGRMPTRYIGPVSRFESPSTSSDEHAGHHLVIVLSGPEPARTRFEARVLAELNDRPLLWRDVLLVRGLPDGAPAPQNGHSPDRLRIVDFLSAAELGPVLAKADCIVTRPGYTTVMDLAALRRPAIYVPTPGQPEQQWLGDSLHATGRGVCVAESGLVLAKAVEDLAKLPKRTSPMNDTDYLLDWIDVTAKRLG